MIKSCQLVASLSYLKHNSPLNHTHNKQSQANNMGVTKQLIKAGDGQTKAKAGDTITMEYTGKLENGTQ